MHYNPLIAAGGQDLIPLVIIIVVVLAQIIKAAKGGSRPAPGQPGPSQQADDVFTAPQDELKKFLESLSGGMSQPPPEQPPPLPRKQSRVMRIKQPAQPPVIETVSVEEVKTSPLQESPKAARQADMQIEAPPIHVMPVTQNIRPQIAYELISRQSIRKAIVLREILGPCLALRRSGVFQLAAGQ